MILSPPLHASLNASNHNPTLGCPSPKWQAGWIANKTQNYTLKKNKVLLLKPNVPENNTITIQIFGFQSALATIAAVCLAVCKNHNARERSPRFLCPALNCSSTHATSSGPSPCHRTYLMLSVCVLYSMMVLGGRLSTLRNVSRIRAVVAWSLAVLFHIEIISSYGTARKG